MNNLTKYIKTLYNDYIKIRFTNYRDKWKCLKETNSNKRLGPPSTLINKGQTITSPKKMAQIANNFFIEKIQKIRDNITAYEIDPIEILISLIPRVKDNFKLKLLTKEDIYKLIDKLKPSKSKGHDELNNNIIKK